MSVHFWHRTCVHCGQGRLYILRRSDSGALYLHCEECEMGWNHPEQAHSLAAGFLTLSLKFDSTEPTLAEIEAAGWARHVIGKADAQRT